MERGGGELGRLRLLLVEDSPDDRDLTVRALGSAGLDFDWLCVSTADGFSDALTTKWDAVVCDYHMPDFDAFRALEILKRRDLDVPFILVSGVLGEEAAVAAMRAGAHDFFAKGRLARLRPAIEREISEARMREERRRVTAEKERLLIDLERALAVRDDFLALASHELRTPLTVLGLQVEALARMFPDANAAAWPRVEVVRRQVDRLAAMVDRCLDVTKLSSEPLHLSPVLTDLRSVVIDVVERSRDWIDQAGCSLALQPLESAVGTWDPVRLDSVVTNLLANALKYGAGKPVTVSTRKMGEQALLSVRDEGIGISDEEQARLFERFSHPSPNANYGGLGLGLWIVDRLTRAHGGGIEVESRKGGGATFTVALPLRGSKGVPASAPPRA